MIRFVWRGDKVSMIHAKEKTKKKKFSRERKEGEVISPRRKKPAQAILKAASVLHSSIDIAG